MNLRERDYIKERIHKKYIRARKPNSMQRAFSMAEGFACIDTNLFSYLDYSLNSTSNNRSRLVMSQNSYANIWFGAPVVEDAELPWENEMYDGDLADWWADVNNCDIELDNTVDSDSAWDMYFEQMDDWKQRHPMPVQIVNGGSVSCPYWIIAVAGTVKEASLSDPTKLPTNTMRVTQEQAQDAEQFCTFYNIQLQEQFYWQLSLLL